MLTSTSGKSNIKKSKMKQSNALRDSVLSSRLSNSSLDYRISEVQFSNGSQRESTQISQRDST